MAEAQSVAKLFFGAQDRLRGGPDRDLCTVDYTADINGNHLDFEGHREFATAFYGAFPDLQHVIDQVDVAEAAERIRFRLVGTHQGEFMGIPATGKAIDISVDAIMTIEDGKVESLTGSFDQGDMMRQLGLS